MAEILSRGVLLQLLHLVERDRTATPSLPSNPCKSDHRTRMQQHHSYTRIHSSPPTKSLFGRLFHSFGSPSAASIPCYCNISSSCSSSPSPSLSNTSIPSYAKDINEHVMGVTFPGVLRLPQNAWGKNEDYICVGAAPRCMQEACFIPMARAYALGVYIQRHKTDSWIDMVKDEERKLADISNSSSSSSSASPSEARSPSTSSAPSSTPLPPLTRDEATALLVSPYVSKTLVFAFKTKKHSTHIIKGFERSIYNAANADKMTPTEFTKFSSELAALKSALSKCCFDPSSRIYITLLYDDNGSNTDNNNTTNTESHPTSDNIGQRGTLLIFESPPPPPASSTASSPSSAASSPSSPSTTTPMDENAKFICLIESPEIVKAFHHLYFHSIDDNAKPKYKTIADSITKQIQANLL